MPLSVRVVQELVDLLGLQIINFINFLTALRCKKLFLSSLPEDLRHQSPLIATGNHLFKPVLSHVDQTGVKPIVNVSRGKAAVGAGLHIDNHALAAKTLGLTVTDVGPGAVNKADITAKAPVRVQDPSAQRGGDGVVDDHHRFLIVQPIFPQAST
ncbi:hypothetical protein SDC9_184406 [bioreactor metagenome]|uniref:Uncharacterized protein n=1 Tax=bioreactor metagenome TaxID=1076179 RepID=A0A645HL66_9ZZZZ